MGRLRQGKGAGRARWLIAFTLLLLLSMATTVAAIDTPSQAVAGESESTPTQSTGSPPDAEEVARGLAAIEAKEMELQEALATPEAVREREASATAYVGIDAQEAQELLNAKFAEEIARLNGDLARFLSDAALDQPLGEFGARITDSKGNTELLESSIPVRAKSDGAALKKVDLELKSSATGYEAQNPLVHVRIGSSLGEGVEVGDEGLTITQVNSKSAESSARAFGDKNLFYSEVAIDTDQLVSPISRGR